MRHFVAHDLSHGESGSPPGIPWRHGDEHGSLEFDPGHVFLGGLALGALVHDPPPAHAALGAALSGLTTLIRDGTTFAYERDYAWTLIALADAAQVFGGGAVAFDLERIGDRLLDRQQRRGFFAIDRPDPQRSGDQPRGAWVATPWVTAGITFEALHRARLLCGGSHRPDPALAREETGAISALERTRIERAIAAALQFLLVDACYENGEFAASVDYDVPGDVVIARQGVADPVDRLLIAGGLARAAEILADRSLRERAEREITVAAERLVRFPLGPNDAARALVGWRMITDTRLRRTLR
jgi:hypothetical protein